LFRLLLLVLLAAAAFVLIEARWTPESMTLTLRVRTARELVAATQRAMQRLEHSETPPVASGPPPRQSEQEPESLRDSDRARLNRLVEEKNRGQ